MGDTRVYFTPRINYVCLLATYYYVFTILTKGIVFPGVGCKLRAYYFIHDSTYLPITIYRTGPDSSDYNLLVIF